MNNDLISRSELKSVLKNECFWCANRDEPCDKSCWRCINEKIDNAPTVTERPKGDLISRVALLEAIRKRLGISSLNFLTEQERVVVEEIFNAPTIYNHKEYENEQ